MSRLAKLKLASKKSLSCFLPNRMETPGTSTLFPSPEPEAPEDGVKPNGTKTADNEGKVPEKKHEASADAPRPPENSERAIVAVGPVESKEPTSKSKEIPKPVEEEEILELKTPGFIRVFGCDNCEDSENDDGRHKDHHTTSSDESEDDESSPRPSAHQPRHFIPVVHLRVPMKNEDDIRKVVAALQLRGVLEVACDLENQIVKVTGNADPHRLLKKVKKVKRKSKLISYSNPDEMPVPPEPSFVPPPTPTPPPPPPRSFHQPAYEERFRPHPQPAYEERFRPHAQPAYEERFRPHAQPAYEERFRPHSQAHVFTGDSYDPYGPPPGYVRSNLRPSARPMHYDSEAFYHHHTPPPNVRPPPPAPGFYRDEAFYPDYIPTNLRHPSSPPHYSSTSFYREPSPSNMRRSTSPPRARSYFYERSAPSSRPPPMHYSGGSPIHRRSSPWGTGVPYDYQHVPDRMMHMYH